MTRKEQNPSGLYTKCFELPAKRGLAAIEKKFEKWIQGEEAIEIVSTSLAALGDKIGYIVVYRYKADQTPLALETPEYVYRGREFESRTEELTTVSNTEKDTTELQNQIERLDYNESKIPLQKGITTRAIFNTYADYLGEE
ncbi:MAG: hypothetical protein D6719_05800 [Candidatus Dadabacteria bacterium]|nr:MAG: hypothetical protein D6719_05800 [Candidatus Dadabacteria bacterium]